MSRWSDVPECGGIFHAMRTLTPFGARMGSRTVPTNAKRLNIGESCLDHSDSGTVCAPARPFISFLLAGPSLLDVGPPTERPEQRPDPRRERPPPALTVDAGETSAHRIGSGRVAPVRVGNWGLPLT